MNYYDELIENIDNLLDLNDFDNAKRLILNELDMPYIPKDLEIKLRDYLALINSRTYVSEAFSDNQIEEYLFKDDEHALIAVQELNSKNLRNYIDLCNKFLVSNANINAKVLLIDSLIRQEINEDITYSHDGLDYTFIPKYVIPFEQSDGYLACVKKLEDVFMKDPSKCQLAKQLLYKEAILALPINIEIEEVNDVCNKIIEYINKAFGEIAD